MVPVRYKGPTTYGCTCKDEENVLQQPNGIWLHVSQEDRLILNSYFFDFIADVDESATPVIKCQYACKNLVGKFKNL